MGPKKKKREQPGVPEWMVTYGDLMSLLLTFFILLASFSELKDPDEFRKVIEVIREALGFRGGMGHIDIPDSPTNATVNMLEEQAKRAANEMHIAEQNESNTVGRREKVSVVHDGSYHTLGKTLWFGPAETALTPDMQRMLREEVAPQIRDRTNIVRIVGHAAGYQDLTGGGFMGVAFERAENVHSFLVDELGVDARILRIEAAGNAEPFAAPPDGGEEPPGDRRVQIYMTDRTLGEVSRDPYGTGRGDN